MDKKPIEQVLQEFGDRVCSEVKKQWNGLSSIDGKSDIDFKIIPNTEPNVIVGRLTASGQKAWIAEYGKGSGMDSARDNPYLEQYRRSEVYNKLRPSNDLIVGRPKGTYHDLDGKEFYSHGTAKGRQVEKPFTQYESTPPYHIIEDNMKKDTGIKELFKQKLKAQLKQNLFNVEVKWK